MRPLIALTLAACCLAVTARPAAAQAAATPRTATPAPARRTLPIDRWISQPTAITLTADQRKKFDSLRADYIRETDELQHPAKAGGDKSANEMAVVMKMGALTARYQVRVRDLLTPEQEAVFLKNVDADVIKP